LYFLEKIKTLYFYNRDDVTKELDSYKERIKMVSLSFLST